MPTTRAPEGTKGKSAQALSPALPERPAQLKRRRKPAGPPPPAFISFEHPKLVEAPPLGEGWIHEVKFDGYRMQVRVEKGRAEWRSRNANDWTGRFADLVDLFKGLPDCILDGEVCILDAEGRPDFSALRSALGRRQTGAMVGALVYFVFDILFLSGEDLTALPSRRASSGSGL